MTCAKEMFTRHRNALVNSNTIEQMKTNLYVWELDHNKMYICGMECVYTHQNTLKVITHSSKLLSKLSFNFF